MVGLVGVVGVVGAGGSSITYLIRYTVSIAIMATGTNAMVSKPVVTDCKTLASRVSW